MKSMISRVICLILAMMMCIATVGCGSEGSVDNSNTTGSNTNQNTNGGYDGDNGAGDTQPDDDVIDTGDYDSSDPNNGLVHFGTHIYTAPEMDDKWLVKDGATQYKLVVAPSTAEYDKTFFDESKSTFLKFFNRSTNAVMPVVVDTELPVTTHSADQHYISLGKTSLLKSLDGTDKAIDYSKDSDGLNGGKITTVDNNVYITGFTDKGVLNLVYTFLRINFNWETYSANTTVYDKNVTNLKLRNYAVHDIPDVQYTATSSYEKSSFPMGQDYGFSHYHPTEGGYYYGQRMLVNENEAVTARQIFEGEPEDIDDIEFRNLTTCSGHNSVKVMKYAYDHPDGGTYGEKYPDWFAPAGVQLCYSAHGNEDSFELMTEYLANMVQRTFMAYTPDKYPYSTRMYVTMTDDRKTCTCETCSTLKSKYNNSGIAVRFFNRVCEKVREWMDKPENIAYKRDDFKLCYYAYYEFENAPAEIDPATGEWKPVDETVVVDKNSMIYWAPIDSDFQQSFFSEDNSFNKNNFDAWVACLDPEEGHESFGYFMYNYNVAYHNYFYDGFDFYNTEFFNYVFSRGRSMYYSENIHGASPTEWGALISYINAKLAYDSTLDSNKLMKDWFDALYGPASGVMQNLLNKMRVFNHIETLKADKYGGRTNRNQVKQLFDWRPEVLFDWVETADSAYNMIEGLKYTNPEEYDRIAYNIEKEAFCPIWIIYDQSMNLTNEQNAAFKARIQANLDKYPEFKYVDGYKLILNA
ncbi:MAG: DUF4838 domain-containing protein [Clostridia bacterium]|nr:DUF4838 domain-containing protein [Clostridia bacterium]